jgi:hypothetical protein
MRPRLLVTAVVLLACTACMDAPPTIPGITAAGNAAGPAVNSTDPNNAPQDTTLDVAVNGSGFDRGSTAQWAIAGVPAAKVRTNSTRYVSPKLLLANITIELDAEPVFYDVLVTTGPRDLSSGGCGLGIVSRSTGAVRTLIPSGVFDCYPADLDWSPDGSEIAFAARPISKRPSAQRLFLVNVASGAITDLTVAERSPSFSPDGRRIVYESLSAAGIYVVDRATGVTTQLSSSGRFPDWRK